MTELLKIAEMTARTAAELAHRRRAEGVEVAATKSSLTDVVTAADREVEQLVLGLLHDARPDDGILGEEGSSVDGTSGVTWVVDPIDGTVNYLYGVGEYAVSIAAVEGEERIAELRATEWRALAAAVASPLSGSVFTAAAGLGARLQGAPIRAVESSSLAKALVATGFGYDAGRRSRQGAAVMALLPEIRDIRRMGAAALDIASCAAGRLDAYYEKGVQPWDIAAAMLIAQEAGCATHLSEVDGDLFAAVAAPGIAGQFFEVLERIDAAAA